MQLKKNTRKEILPCKLKPLFHSSQKPTRKLPASAFKYCDWMKVFAASLRVGFRDKWKRASNEEALRVSSNFHEMKDEWSIPFSKKRFGSDASLSKSSSFVIKLSLDKINFTAVSHCCNT